MKLWPSNGLSTKKPPSTDSNQIYSKAKYFELLHRPASLQRNIRQMIMILLLPPLGTVALTLLPLGDPKEGLKGANWNILFMGTCLATGGQTQLCARFHLMMRSTSVTLKQQMKIVAAGVLVFFSFFVCLGTFYRFPVPFRTCNVGYTEDNER